MLWDDFEQISTISSFKSRLPLTYRLAEKPRLLCDASAQYGKCIVIEQCL
jgi:hypothetical protein